MLDLAKSGISLERTARIIVRSVLEQSMHHRLYQVDPHAGNLIVMKDGTLGWIDLGMVGWLDEKLWAGQYKMRQAIVSGNINQAYLSFLETLEPLPRKNLSSFEAEAKECFRDWISASSRTNTTLQEKSSGFFFTRLLLLVRKEGLSLPVNLVRLYRAIIIADGVSLKLYPPLDWVDVMAEFIQDEEMRLFEEKVASALSVKNIASIVELTLSTPEIVKMAYSWVRKDLPDFKREYQFQEDRITKVVGYTLRFIQVSIVFILLLVAGRLIPVTRGIVERWLIPYKSLTQPPPALIIIVGIAVLIFLSRIIRFLKRSA